MNSPNIYDPAFVETLFSQMSATYNRVNTITSFGFSIRWRRQCVAMTPLKPGMTVVDLMTGMGEAWPWILSKIGKNGALIALDFCPEMIRFAKQQAENRPDYNIQIVQEDALQSSIPNACADAVISSFGLKTFNSEQIEKLAQEIHRILKPGGTFALVEISKPQTILLQSLYLVYLRFLIPFLGKLFLGNPDNYRMLGIYTMRFKNCREAQAIFKQNGLQVDYRNLFGGCASAISGAKPV